MVRMSGNGCLQVTGTDRVRPVRHRRRGRAANGGRTRPGTRDSDGSGPWGQAGGAVDEPRTGPPQGWCPPAYYGQAPYAEAVRAQVPADGLVPAADLLLPLLAVLGQVGDVPVDAFDPVEGGGGHHRLRRDAQ